MEKEKAIEIINVSKLYRTGQIGGHTLIEDIQSRHALKHGLPDPSATISKEHIWGKTFWALKGINLSIYKGETVGIIGENGAGKSTLLKLLSRITAPTEGRILLSGRVSSLLEVGTGFNSEMTGRENIYLSGSILGMSRKEINEKLEDIIEFSEVREFIDTPIKRYSSGMYIKLGFSVAAHLDSEIIIMDEVLAVGDAAFQKKCLAKMKSLARDEGRTVVYISHNMNTIRDLCDRVVVLKSGSIIYDGNTESGIERYCHYHIDENRRFYNYDDQEIYERDISRLPARISSIELLEKEKWIFTPEEHMKFRIHIKTLRAYKMLELRLIFEKSGQLLGAIPHVCMDNWKAGDDRIFDLCIPIEYFAEGKYFINLFLGEVTPYGSGSAIDRLNDALFFEIHRSADDPWKSSGWGSILFPSPEINEVC